MFSDVEEMQVCQFVGLYADKTVDFGWRNSYRILVYGAERIPGGGVSREFNGVAVLRNNPDAANNPGSQTWFLTKYRLAQADADNDGMTAAQLELFNQLCGAATLLDFVEILSQQSERAPVVS